jgi:hypothetical protein
MSAFKSLEEKVAYVQEKNEAIAEQRLRRLIERLQSAGKSDEVI